MSVQVAYTGINTVRGVEGSLSRGVTPSAFTLTILPQPLLNLPPGKLSIKQDGGAQIELHGCVIDSAFLRRRYEGKELRWAVTLYDRRWRWAFGSISGEYNRRLPNGLVDENTVKHPAELIALCFQAMGEVNFDLSRVPIGVLPYVNWQQETPALALAWLLDDLACEVVLNWKLNRAEIWPLGTGGELPNQAGTGYAPLFPKLKHAARQPSSIQVHGGPSLFQTKLELEAVGRQDHTNPSATNGHYQQKKIDELAHKPEDGWEEELPLSFVGVSDTEDRVHAFDTNWRQYRVKGQDGGGLNVPFAPGTKITSVDQYLLNDYLVKSEKDIDDYLRTVPAYIEGEYWPYSDLPSSIAEQRYVGPFFIRKDHRLVEFPYPLFGLEAGVYEKPTLKLVTSYRLREENGQLVHVAFAGPVGGSAGTLVLKRPWVFAAYAEGVNTEAQANAELDKYVQFFRRKHQAAYAAEVQYTGIVPLSLDGRIAQVRWSAAVNRAPQTLGCEYEELDAMSLSRGQRRRRELVNHLQERLGGYFNAS